MWGVQTRERGGERESWRDGGGQSISTAAELKAERDGEEWGKKGKAESKVEVHIMN